MIKKIKKNRKKSGQKDSVRETTRRFVCCLAAKLFFLCLFFFGIIFYFSRERRENNEQSLRSVFLQTRLNSWWLCNRPWIFLFDGIVFFSLFHRFIFFCFSVNMFTHFFLLRFFSIQASSSSLAPSEILKQGFLTLRGRRSKWKPFWTILAQTPSKTTLTGYPSQLVCCQEQQSHQRHLFPAHSPLTLSHSFFFLFSFSSSSSSSPIFFLF